MAYQNGPNASLEEPLLSELIDDQPSVQIRARLSDNEVPPTTGNNGVSNDLSNHENISVTDGHSRGSATSDHINPWKNRNVILSLILCVVSGTADSIWGSVVLSGFLLALAKAMGRSQTGNTLVGSAEAVQGLTELVIALPVGYLADTWGKSKTVRLGGWLMLLTIALTLWALEDIHEHASDSRKSADRSYVLLVVALALWGVIEGISFGPSQALFSDSIPKGRRSEMLTWLYTCYLVSSAVGPIVSIVLILTVSNDREDWSLQEIYPVFVIGVALEIPAAIVMMLFSDKHVVPEPEDEETEQQESLEVQLALNEPLLDSTDQSDGGVESPQEECPEDCQSQSLAADADDADATPHLQQLETSTPSTSVTTRAISISSQDMIPYVLFITSLISSLGSGASVKYFPLFFKQLGFGSAEVQGIFLVVPLFIAALSFVAQKCGNHAGRIETTVVFTIVGVCLLYFMTWLSKDVQDSAEGGKSMWDEKPHLALFIVGVYLFRTGMMNCSYPLLESVLMDNVPSNQRARWKSLESIASFGWTGSAFLGGVLSDEHSYQFTFAITATLQLVGGLLLLVIQPFVKKEGT